MFTWTEKDLNTEQAKAVRFPGSLFLVACPGSGKTRTLTYKIAYELSQLNTTREFVAAITYTHRAADEIRERIEDLGVDTAQLWIGTIHSFCLEWILKPYRLYETEIAHGFRVIDMHEREKLLDRLCESHRGARITSRDCDYYFNKDDLVLGCQDIRKHKTILQVLGDYFDELAANQEIDFELILWYAYQLISKNPPISNLLSKIFKVILVDEYQDTKEIQYEIIASILRAGRGGTRLFMVGDPNQAIYGSLGGYPIELEKLRSLCGVAINSASLSRNYRSSTRIVNYFSKFNVHDTSIQAVGSEYNYPSLISFNKTLNHEDLVDEIARLVKHNVEDLGISPSEICILAPQWVHLATMTRRLTVRIPEYEFDGPGMVPFARDIENFWYRLARLALTDPSPAMYIRRFRWAGDILNDLKEFGVKTEDFSRKMLLRECNAISIGESDGLSYLREFFDGIFARLKIPFHEFSHLEEHYQAFFESSESRIRKLEKEGVDGVGGIEFFRKVFQNRAGITVSTIHGVKGAEFDVVIAYALLEGMVPHFNDRDGDLSAQKMLYVIGSRARKNLHLFSEAGRKRGRYDVYEPTSRLAAYQFPYSTV